MKPIMTAALFTLFTFTLVGCSTAHQFVKKPGQSEQAFYQDKIYCQSGASGQNQQEKLGERWVPYAECMLNLGYQKKAVKTKLTDK